MYPLMRSAMDGLTQGTLAVLLLSSVHGKGFWVTEKDIGAEVQVSEMNQTLNWASSASSCRRRGGHLYVETSDNTVESLASRLEEDTLYWVGGTVVTQSWYWEGTQDRLYTYRGYIPASTTGKNRATHYVDNQAFTCFTFCNSIYIALKETECVCLRYDPTPGNSSTSSVLCPGNREESCGDAGGYSVYSDKLPRLAKFRKARMNDFRYVWGVLEISSDSNTVATSDSQTEMLMALCSTTSHDARVPITIRSTRQEARKTCENRQGSLLQVTGTINNLQPGRYWIGLRRGFSWVWITGKPVLKDTTNASLPYRCLSVRKRRNTVRIENQDCAKPLRYICLTGESGSSGGEGYAWALPTGVAGAAAVLIIIAAEGCCTRRLKRKGVAKVKHKKNIGDGKRHRDGKRPRRESTDVEYSEVGDSTMMPSSPDSFAAEEGEYHIPYNAALCIGGRVQPYNEGMYSHTGRLGGEGANADYDVSTVNRIPSTPLHDDYDHIGSLAEQSEKDPPGYDTPRSTRRSVNVAEVKATKVKDENDHQRTEATCLPIQVSYSERENTTGLQYDTPRRGSPITVAHSDVAGAESRNRGVNTPAYDVPRSDRTGHVAQL